MLLAALFLFLEVPVLRLTEYRDTNKNENPSFPRQFSNVLIPECQGGSKTADTEQLCHAILAFNGSRATFAHHG